MALYLSLAISAVPVISFIVGAALPSLLAILVWLSAYMAWKRRSELT